jgi:hypothetical protein
MRISNCRLTDFLRLSDSYCGETDNEPQYLEPLGNEVEHNLLGQNQVRSLTPQAIESIADKNPRRP